MDVAHHQVGAFESVTLGAAPITIEEQQDVLCQDQDDDERQEDRWKVGGGGEEILGATKPAYSILQQVKILKCQLNTRVGL